MFRQLGSIFAVLVLFLSSVSVRADETEVDPADEKPAAEAKAETPSVAEADRILARVPDTFFIVQEQSDCPSYTKPDGSIDFDAIEKCKPFSLKSLPVETQRRLIMGTQGQDWNAVTSSDNFSQRFNLKLAPAPSNFGKAVKEKIDEYSKGCRIKRMKHNGVWLGCTVKF